MCGAGTTLGGMRADETKRNDPELRAAVRLHLHRRAAEAGRVADLLDMAVGESRGWRDDRVMAGRVLPDLTVTARRLREHAAFLAEANDTYVANAAAFLTDEQADTLLDG